MKDPDSLPYSKVLVPGMNRTSVVWLFARVDDVATDLFVALQL
jgi:hypothetical protein